MVTPYTVAAYARFAHRHITAGCAAVPSRRGSVTSQRHGCSGDSVCARLPSRAGGTFVPAHSTALLLAQNISHVKQQRSGCFAAVRAVFAPFLVTKCFHGWAWPLCRARYRRRWTLAYYAAICCLAVRGISLLPSSASQIFTRLTGTHHCTAFSATFTASISCSLFISGRGCSEYSRGLCLPACYLLTLYPSPP